MAWPVLSCGGGSNPGGRPALSISLGVSPGHSGQAAGHTEPPSSTSGGSAAVSVTALPVTLWISVGASERISGAVDWLMGPLSAPAHRSPHDHDGTYGAPPKMTVDVAVNVQHVCLVGMLPRCSSSLSGGGAGGSGGRQPACGFVAVEITAVGSGGQRLPSWQAPDRAPHEMRNPPLLR